MFLLFEQSSNIYIMVTDEIFDVIGVVHEKGKQRLENKGAID